MKPIFLTLAATVLTLAGTSTIQANPKASGHGQVKSSSGHSNFKDYHLSHGTRFEHGYLYKGKNHEHWGETRYDSHYGCNIYRDRCLNAWYYWCERDTCYYPVSYCPYRTYVCPPIRPVVVVQPVRPVIVAEPVRPVYTPPVRPIVAEPVRPCCPPPTNVRVDVQVNVRTASATTCP